MTQATDAAAAAAAEEAAGEETLAVTVFEELQVPATIQTKIVESDPEFADRPPEEQRELVEFMLDQANLTTDGVRSRLPMVKIRHGGAKVFELPPEIGGEDVISKREFIAIILDQYTTKAWWEDEDNVGGRPDCASLDAIKPYVKSPQNHDCISCPHNQWGSATKGRGKRCRDAKRLILALDGHELPVRLQISSANIKLIDTYLSNLRDQGAPIGTVITRFRAVEARNEGGIEYTGVEFDTERKLDGSEILAVRRNKVVPFKDDFRVGFIESGDEGDSGDKREPEERPRKATEVM
jgi:hypothetical protein